MAQPELTPLIRTSPLILQRPDGGTSLIFDAAPASAMPPAKKVKSEGETYTVVGYRQTLEPAVRGGSANRNGFRVRVAGMRALARSFRGRPFITGHSWGDVRDRGGTIVDAWVEQTDVEVALLFELRVTEDWAIRGFEGGTIDRFSFAIEFVGEITCTLHDAPIWTEPECYCWPGIEVDGQVVEFEVEDALGLELSAVNVPAVEGTYVVNATAGSDVAQRLQAAAALGHRCGRMHPAIARFAMGGGPEGGFRARRVPPTMARDEQPEGNTMDRALICEQLGLPATATDAEVKQRIATLGADAAKAGVLAAQLEQTRAEREAERDQAHVETEITKLRASHSVTDKVVAGLRDAARPPGGIAAFDAALSLVRESAPAIATGIGTGPGAAPLARAALQSDARPAAASAGAPATDPDAYELGAQNPHLSRYMRAAAVSVDDVRRHGARSFHVVPNLRELAEATALRG